MGAISMSDPEVRARMEELNAEARASWYDPKWRREMASEWLRQSLGWIYGPDLYMGVPVDDVIAALQ